jgi:hypothetical protein
VTEAQTNPLQILLNEFKTLSPETTNTLIFNSDGQIIANTKIQPEEETKKLISDFCSIAQQAQTIGGIENLVIQAVDSQLTVTTMDDLYLTMVSSRAASQEIVKSLTQVVVPTVVKLINQRPIMTTEIQSFSAIDLEEKPKEIAVLPAIEEPIIEPVPEAEESEKPFEQILPFVPINQLMVEKIVGLLVPTDTVRIDDEVIAKWSDLYGGKQILMVNIEALDGKKTTCKVKPIKESKNNVKGAIQIPERILQNLQTEKGKLVMVKPVVE